MHAAASHHVQSGQRAFTRSSLALFAGLVFFVLPDLLFLIAAASGGPADDFSFLALTELTSSCLPLKTHGPVAVPALRVSSDRLSVLLLFC